MKMKFRLPEKARYFLYTLLCAFISVGVYGQRQLDTINVVMLVSDTTEIFYAHMTFTHGEIINGQCVDYYEKDTVWTENRNYETYWKFGKEVLELHNTSEGSIDPGICPSCWRNYWVHKEYLDEIGYELPKGLIVWQSVRSK